MPPKAAAPAPLERIVVFLRPNRPSAEKLLSATKKRRRFGNQRLVCRISASAGVRTPPKPIDVPRQQPARIEVEGWYYIAVRSLIPRCMKRGGDRTSRHEGRVWKRSLLGARRSRCLNFLARWMRRRGPLVPIAGRYAITFLVFVLG
jgi:hypothetical protein